MLSAASQESSSRPSTRHEDLGMFVISVLFLTLICSQDGQIYCGIFAIIVNMHFMFS